MDPFTTPLIFDTIIGMSWLNNLTDFQIYLSIAYAIIILFALLGIAIGLKTYFSKRQFSYLWYSVMHVFIVIWVVSLYLLLVVKIPVIDFVPLGKIVYISSLFTITFLGLFLVNEFTNKKDSLLKNVNIIYLGTTIIASIISWPGENLIINYNPVTSTAEFGPFRGIISILLVVQWLFPFFYLRFLQQKRTSVQRFQLRYLLPALLITLILTVGNNIVLPIIFHNSSLSVLGPIYTAFYFGTIFYLTFNYNLFSISKLVQKFVYTTLITIFILVIYFVLRQDLLPESIKISILIFIAVNLNKIVRFFNLITNSFDRTKSQFSGVEKLLNTMAKELNLAKIIDLVSEHTNEIFELHGTSMFLFNQESKKVITGGYSKRDSLILEEILKYLNKNNYHSMFSSTDNLENIMGEEFAQKAKHFMKKNKISHIIPLNKKIIMNGLLIIKEKKEGILTKDQISLIETIANNTSVAISRAFLYQEQLKFAQKLESEVKERTADLHVAQKDLERKNHQLTSAYAELKTLDDAKSEFISIASHQLRTPISIIRGYLSMMESGDFGEVSEAQFEALEKTSSNIRQLNDIVEDILNASRIEKGKIALATEKADVVELTKDVVGQLVEKARMKGLSLECEGDKEPFPISMDRNKIYEVIMNLVDNAIHYTQKGSVTVSCKKTKTKIIISVKDTGIGIPKEFQNKIFQRFSRSDNAKAIRPDGTGIGLYVAKSFVEAHKGKLWFESVEGKGTTFFVELKKSPKLDNDVNNGQTTVKRKTETKKKVMKTTKTAKKRTTKK